MTAIKCAVTTCENTGEPNGSGCVRGRRGQPSRRVPVFLCGTCSGVAGGPWSKRREASGLSLGQAARILGMTVSRLYVLEAGGFEPAAALAEDMRRLYAGEMDLREITRRMAKEPVR